MSDEQLPVVPEEKMAFWATHRFLLLLVLTVIVALVLTAVSLVLYNVSGTAQLDLSRPGYQSVSDQVETNNDIDEYGAFGAVNKTTVDEFTTIYDKQATKVKAVDAFNGDPLNPEVLEFGASNISE